MRFGVSEMREFAARHADPRVVSIWKRLEDARNKNARWCERCGELEDLLRWRKWPEEKPEKDGDYFCANSGRCFVAGFEDGSWLENYGTDELQADVQYWRPIGPLPGEGGE